MQYLAQEAIAGRLRSRVGCVPFSRTTEAHRLLEERQVIDAIVLDPQSRRRLSYLFLNRNQNLGEMTFSNPNRWPFIP
jgi:hypothetical protein